MISLNGQFHELVKGQCIVLAWQLWPEALPEYHFNADSSQLLSAAMMQKVGAKSAQT